jgi:hypothetical protein
MITAGEVSPETQMAVCELAMRVPRELQWKHAVQYSEDRKENSLSAAVATLILITFENAQLRDWAWGGGLRAFECDRAGHSLNAIES